MIDLEAYRSEAETQDFFFADGVMVKQIVLPVAGSIVPQHAHKYDHTSFIASGALYAWADGKPLGRYTAPAGLLIRAGVKHTFQTIEPDTVILCIHNATRPDVAAVLEEHEITVEELAALAAGEG